MRVYLQLFEGDFLKLFCMMIKFRGNVSVTGFYIQQYIVIHIIRMHILHFLEIHYYVQRRNFNAKQQREIKLMG